MTPSTVVDLSTKLSNNALFFHTVFVAYYKIPALIMMPLTRLASY